MGRNSEPSGRAIRVHSSRRLARECRRNLDVIWLLEGLTPGDRTIADFRKANGPALRRACKDFVVLCKELARAMRLMLDELVRNADLDLGDHTPAAIRDRLADSGGLEGGLAELLSAWCRLDPTPLVLLIDENEIITGGSAFNIKTESIRMGDFSEADVSTLYQQHSDETAQPFTPQALASVWHWTRGQPWLVNAIGYPVTFRRKDLRDRTRTIDAEAIDQAAETLIQRRDTHLDQLTDKLREPRVRRVVEAMLAGEEAQRQASEEDIHYVTDLGLVNRSSGHLAIANPIYREIIPRQLTFMQQLDLEAQYQTAWYIQSDGRLDMPKLLTTFQQFFRDHSEHWLARFDYQEAGPQLLLQALLQRIVNGGGHIEREYGLGRMRTDLLLRWPYGDRQLQTVVLELKLVHKGLELTLAQSLEQTFAYADRCAAAEAHLIIFDRRDRPWEDKLLQRDETVRGRLIRVWGM